MSVRRIPWFFAATIVLLGACRDGSQRQAPASRDASALAEGDAGGVESFDSNTAMDPDAIEADTGNGDASADGGDTDANTGGDLGTDTPPTCPPPASDTCVDPPPSFANTILPILDRSCNTCHDPNVPDGPWPLTSYADVMAWRLVIANELVACSMPPPDGGTTLTESDRQVLFAWLACEAPPDP